MVDKRQYAERRSGELLPRHASAYIPPHRIPAQPDARTMENRTVRVAPELDPRLAMTQVSMQRVREQRRGYWGIIAAAALGSLLAVGVYTLLPRALLGQSSSVANALPERAAADRSGLERAGATALTARPGALAPGGSAQPAALGGRAPAGHGSGSGTIGVSPVDDALPETGVVEEITDPSALPRTTSRVAAARSKRPKSSQAAKSSRAAQAPPAAARGSNSSAARGQQKADNSETTGAEDSADGIKIEGSRVWLE